MSHIDITDLSDRFDLLANVDYSINLKNDSIGLSEANKIAGLLNGRKVTNLTLRETQISDEALEVIAKALEKVSNTIYIYLDENNIDDVGASVLAKALKNKNVRTLSLNNNRISDAGAICLAASLHNNKDLALSLTKNKIGAIGAEALVKAWSYHSYTSLIDLSDNNIGNEGAKKIALALKDHPGKIKTLWLRRNEIGLEGDKALAEHLPSSVKEVVYRTKKVNFAEFSQKHPYLAAFTTLFTLGIAPFMKFDEDIEGLIHQRTAR